MIPELTKQQEEFVLEEQESRKINHEEFSDWFSDNQRQLRSDFISQNEDSFLEYCKEEYKIWRFEK